PWLLLSQTSPLWTPAPDIVADPWPVKRSLPILPVRSGVVCANPMVEVWPLKAAGIVPGVRLMTDAWVWGEATLGTALSVSRASSASRPRDRFCLRRIWLMIFGSQCGETERVGSTNLGSLSAQPVDQHVELSLVEPIEVRERNVLPGSVTRAAPLPDDSPTLA